MSNKKFMTTILIVVIALSSLLVFAGCSKQAADDVSTNKSGDGKYAKKFTYTINSMYAGQQKDGNRLYDYISKKFNIELEIRPINWGDWNEKVRIWVASGDMPEILRSDVQASTHSEFINWAKQGIFRELPDELLSKYPNLKRLNEELISDEYVKVDGKRYAWLASIQKADYNNVSQMMFYYRKDWAKKVGIYHENNEYTFEEMKAMAKAFVEEDVSGTGKTIGIGGIGWAFPWFAGIYQVDPKWEGYIYKDGQYVWGPGEPEMVEGIKETKEWYESGILWKDQPIAQNNDAGNKFVSGELGIYFNNWTSYTLSEEIIKPFEAANPGLEAEDTIAPMFVKGPKGTPQEGKVLGIQGSDYWSATMFRSDMSDEKLARWLEVYDWLASEEGRNYVHYGIKGEDWKYDDAGNVVPLWPEKEDGTLQGPSDVKADWAGVVNDSPKWEFENPGYSEYTRKLVAEVYDRLRQDDVYLKPTGKEEYKINFFSGPMKNKYGTFTQKVNDKITELIVSSSADEIEKDWKDFVESMRPKVQKVVDELNENLQ
ncbi:carbohydrate ABC transporter substrate-binding protein (CUT1 family) [Orenia metallireducens]|uniref:Carbohydrate ABC transporter substrate-binding protein, CUT1 family n=1 Tax=Orenia metallireducens TaxID=1413210 RepID=A0A285FZK7_9FIRM|nr:hypothetical protein [Orenia metallireducens]PRX35623.1 carbohydrate ABC transporter substrate-binding protein (CUT1 family) [Orenia metallireducens]SNY15661.1 carbohydrate ABC transporter substrate-binding protein, CUT1 family [Orenia metallireducens]